MGRGSASQVPVVVKATPMARDAPPGSPFVDGTIGPPRDGIRNIPLIHIVRGNNDRQSFDPVLLDELAQSIGQYGLAQPITVRPSPRPATAGLAFGGRVASGDLGDHYQIMAGERRFWAASMLGWTTIPCIVRGLDDEAASAIMLAENTSRADLNPIEEAEAYQSRIDRFGWTPSKIAEIAGVSENTVERRLSLLRLREDVQLLVRHGNMGIGMAEALTVLDPNRQGIVLRVFNESRGMTLTQFKALVNDLLEQQSQEALLDLESLWVQQVQGEEWVASGRKARVNVPKAQYLPPVEYTGQDTTGKVIARYINRLAEGGFATEAAAIGTLFEALVHGNYCALPRPSEI